MSTKFLIPPFMMFCRFPLLAKVALATVMSMNLWANTAYAGDPFRSSEPRKIGDRTEAAFKAIFQDGNYPAAEDFLKKAISDEPDEPLAYAMKAALAYTNQDLGGLDRYSKKTLEAGQKLIASDPLRGNLYTGVGNFLEGAVILLRDGSVNGVSKALSRLTKVYEYLDKAEAISENDPELNLIRGYMNLMLAVNLPFTSPDQAIENLEKNAAPGYLVNRGIALAYRDLKKYSQALDYVNRALKITADNPEIYYLKAQILHEKGKKEKSQDLIKDAIANFDKALTKKSQLSAGLVKQIEYERSQAMNRLNNL
ncbi:tetratricopeptide repeat protein [Sphaerospermopsis aphanizomenoides BCCUSP55]|uniref:Sll0314/Alr1548 family TPR repeat-containing protein n=1 Tax=Sphaerospermopsis aphanizomenoides TaxID=459663 RepID=UPI000ADEFA77|nr:Sll0314/Alr1548 family TPR repeat-containing protein [Sphaerospermopsis aphanizomenoides]MBK1988616.1 tetratricopeptide repeat protein [Sphaerospermopsis aphanizomenoides BCCUSP55]